MTDTAREKRIFLLIVAVSVVVFAIVLYLSQLPKSENIPWFVPLLPRLNAVLNGTCTLLLIISFYFIRRKKILLHKKLNITAFLFSTLFLASYVLFHSYGIETRFPDYNPWRPVYLVILISHIVLAAIVLPLVLLSFYYGLTMQVKKHRAIVRFSFPVWLYVTISGVIVYLMISPYYRF
jgi:putative membrane protein